MKGLCNDKVKICAPGERLARVATTDIIIFCLYVTGSILKTGLIMIFWRNLRFDVSNLQLLA